MKQETVLAQQGSVKRPSSSAEADADAEAEARMVLTKGREKRRVRGWRGTRIHRYTPPRLGEKEEVVVVVVVRGVHSKSRWSLIRGTYCMRG